MNTQSKLLIVLLSILFILYAENLALSKEIKSATKEQQDAKTHTLTHVQIISEAQRSVDRSLTALSYTIIAIGVLVSLFTLIIIVLGGVFGFLGFKTYGNLKKEIGRIEDIAGKSETKYKEIEDTFHKVKPIVDKIDRYEKDINDIKEEYKNKIGALSILEKPSEETRKKLDELTKKSEFLEDMGAKLGPEDYFNRGLDYAYKNDFKKARKAFEEVVELDSNHVFAWYNLGIALLELTEYEEANKFCDKAIGMKPDYAIFWYGKGCILIKMEKYEEAIRNHDKAIELNSDNANAWCNKAYAYSSKGDKEKSLESLRKSIELDSKYKEEAKKDEDFKVLWDDEDFKRIVE